MRKLITLTAMTAALLGTACAKAEKETPVDTSAPAAAETAATTEDWNSTLAGVGTSKVTGSARAMAGNGQTEVTIQLAGVAPGAVHPWHVHAGKCGTANAPIVGDPAAYTPVTVAADSAATSTATIAVELKDEDGKDFHVNVHQSASRMNVIVACGELDD